MRRTDPRPPQLLLAEEGAEPEALRELELLRQRARLMAACLFVLTLGFAAVDPWIAPHASVGLYWLKLAGAAGIGLLWHFTSRARSRAALMRATIVTLLCVQAITAPSTIMVGIGWHSLTVAGGIALGAAALFPWGLRTQLRLIAGLLVLALIPVVWLARADTDVFPVAAALFSMIASAVFARQNERHHRATQQQLRSFRENLAHLQQVTEHVHGVLWLSEVDGSLLYVSPRFEEIWGQRIEHRHATRQAWLAAVHPEDRHRVTDWIGTRGLRGASTCEYRLQRPDGGTRWIRDAIFPIIGARGELWRIARLSLDVTSERDAARVVAVQAFAREVQRVIEAERKRVARDLHDDLGQALTAIKLILTTLAVEMPPPTALAGRLTTCVEEIDRAMRGVRAMIQALRPPILDELGLAAALRAHAEGFANQTGIDVQLDLPPEEASSLGEETATTVFRIVQEALTNVARHAGAARVVLRMDAGTTGVDVRIEDDGGGIRSGRENFGLLGMRERAALLDGTLAVAARDGGGTIVHLHLPPRPPESGWMAAEAGAASPS